MAGERPETNLVQLPIDNPSEAHARFGEKTGEGYTPLVFVPHRRPFGSLRMVIPEGFDSIVTENGKVLGVFKPGLYYRSYFYQIAYLVNTQHIPYNFAVRSCPTRDNVRVDIDVDFLFHVADSMRFVLQIAPENMEELLRATQAESVRSLVRTVRVDQARDLRGMNSEDMLMTLNDKLNVYGIHIDQVTIASVKLPEDVAMNMQTTTAFESKQQLLAKQQTFDLKVLNDAEYVKAQQQARENEKQRAEEVAKKNRQVIEQQIEELEAKLAKELEAIKAQLNDRVAEIKSQCELEIGRTNAERDKLVNETMENGKLEQTKIALEAEAYVARVRGETAAKIAETRAKILAIRAEAERYAGERLKAKREHELQMHRLQMITALAANPRSFISGDVGENPLAQLLAATRTAVAMGLKVPGAPSPGDAAAVSAGPVTTADEAALFGAADATM